MKIELIDVRGFIPAILGARLSMQSKGDSGYENPGGFYEDMLDRGVEFVGEKDKELAIKLSKAGDSHGAYSRMIWVWVRLKASRMWWHQWDKYKFQNNMYQVEERSASTMHTIADDELEFDENTSHDSKTNALFLQKKYKEDPKNEWKFLLLKYSLPEGLLQERIVNLNYQALRTIYQDRQNHRLPEWKELCEWIKTLPHSEIITEARK